MMLLPLNRRVPYDQPLCPPTVVRVYSRPRGSSNGAGAVLLRCDVKREEMIGHRFGRLVVTNILPSGTKPSGTKFSMCECRCDCGTTKSFRVSNIRSGHTRSCGCLSDEERCSRATHGMSCSPEYRVWRSMISRCENHKIQRYDRYGGRGIRVCSRWRSSFSAFIEDMGRRPGRHYTIERVDNDGDYEPSNCVWATKSDQARNRITSRIIEFDGKKQTLQEWSEETGIQPGTIWHRLKSGWSTKRALTQPVRKLVREKE